MTEESKRSDEPLGFTLDGIINAAGGSVVVAKALGLKVQTIAKWDRRVPGKHARQVAILAGLPLEIVRPDLVRKGHEQALAYVQGKGAGNDE